MTYEMIRSDQGMSDSAVYEGEWARGKREGFGKMSWADGSSFEGQWNLDFRVNGVMIMIDQSVYKGPFKNE